MSDQEYGKVVLQFLLTVALILLAAVIPWVIGIVSIFKWIF